MRDTAHTLIGAMYCFVISQRAQISHNFKENSTPFDGHQNICLKLLLFVKTWCGSNNSHLIALNLG